MVSVWCIDWVVSLYANQISKYFYIKSSIGNQVKLAGCKIAFNPQVVHSTDRSKAVVLLLVLLFVALWFILWAISLSLALYYLVLVFFSVLLAKKES